MNTLEPKKKGTKGVYFAFVCKFCKTVFTSVPDIIKHKLKEHVKKQHVPNSTKGTDAKPDNEEHTAQMAENVDEGEIDVASSSNGTQELGLQIKSTLSLNAPPRATYSCPSLANLFNAQSESALQPINLSKQKNRMRRKRRSLNGYRCTECSKLFDSVSTLDRHRLLHTRPFPCQHCAKRWPSAAHLNNHVDRVHTGKNKEVEAHRLSPSKIYPCSMCPFSTKIYKSLFTHKKQHGTQHQYKCTECTCTFTTQIGLSRHRIWSHQKTLPKLKATQLVKVKNNVQKSSKVACTLCSKSVSARGITAHRKLYHPREPPYVCMECSFKSKCQPNMWRHRRSHSVRSKFSCPHCTASYDTLRKTNFHIRRVHPNYEVISTPEVNGRRTSATKDSAKTAAPRQHACNACPKKFRLQCQLKKHSVVHAKAYNCKHCPQKLNYAHSLRIHVNQFHKQTIVKDDLFRCPCCPMLLASASKLELHIKIYHPRYKFYECQECAFKAANQVALRQHSVIHRMSKRCASIASHRNATIPELNNSNTVGKTNHKGSHAAKISRGQESNHGVKVSVKCRICSITFPTRKSYDWHFLQRHRNEKPYQCVQCSATYRSYQGLQNHESVHFFDNERCNTILSNSDITSGSNVVTTQNDNGEPTAGTLSNTNKIPVGSTIEQLTFKCSECPKRFGYKAALVIHNRTFHSSLFVEME